MTSQTSLAELLAVRLSAPENLNSPDFWSMATLLRNDMAVTPNHVVADLAPKRNLPLLLHFDRPMHAYELDEPQRELGLVMQQFPEWDIAVIEFTASSADLSAYLERAIPADLFAASIPFPETPWESFVIIPAAPEGMPIRGIAEGLEMIEGIPYLRLRMTEYPGDWSFEQWRGISGAPIVLGDKLCGIVGRMHTSEPVLYALPATEEIGEQWRWELLEENVEIVKIPVSDTDGPAAREEFTPENFLRRLSPAASRAMARADELRRDGKERALYVEYIWIALAENSEDIPAKFFQAQNSDTRGIIELVLSNSDMGNYSVGADEPPPLTTLPRLSDQLSAAFQYVYDFASSRDLQEIETWHLLTGLLAVPRSAITKALNEQGITLESLFQFMESVQGREVQASADETNPDPSYIIPGLRNDQVGDTDLLNIEPEAMTLASVIAARDVSPPFSIGLFGEWGSGKTFFMGEMERSIKRLVQDANSSDGASPYCTNIVQIWFNSWHYIDTDLWASLTSEIFEGLAAAFSPAELETEQRTLQRLMADKRRTVDLLAETTQQMERAEQELQQSEQRLQQLTSDTALLELKLDPMTIAREAARYAADQPEVREKIRMAADAIGDDVMKKNASEVAQELPEFLRETNQLRLIWSSLGSSRNQLMFLLWMVVVGGIIASAIFLLPALIASDFWRLVTGLAASVLATYQMLRPITKGAQQALKYFNQANDAREKFITAQQTKRKAELQLERDKKQSAIQQTRNKLTELHQEIKSTTEKLDKLNPATILADFIGDRDKSDDYRKRLGVITNTRNDFERLSALMKRVREQRPEDIADTPSMLKLPKVDRVILYIDDLDRCPEDRVVEVLQAVHLLLAFDPFVVVVGVDPRWLLRALKQHTRIFDINDDDSGGIEEHEQSHWHSTPMNYLEKIFQIPFSLRPMGTAGFDKLIDSLAAPMAAENAGAADGRPSGNSGQRKDAPETQGSTGQPASGQHQEAPAGTEPEGTPEHTIPARNGGATTGSRGPIPAPAEPADHVRKDAVPTIPAPIPKHLSIEEWERNDMKKFNEFIPSPRALKRFVNIYRLLRTSVAEKDRRAFIGSSAGGDYRAVLLLLAIQTGHPEEAATIIQMLLNESRERPWWEFIESLRHRCQPPLPSEARPHRGGTMNAERWTALFRKLDAFKRRHPSFVEEAASCGDFIAWAPAAARYSFHSGRIVATEPAHQPAA